MNSFKHYLIILAISLLPFVFIVTTPDLPHTHDGAVHLPRIAAYVKALADGHIPVRWAGDLNYGYGLPLFNFIYHTPYFLASLFVFLGLSLVFSFKLTLILSFFLSGILMYSFAKELLKNEKKALFIALFYQFAPFRLIEIFTRGSIGSLFAYTFLPLVLLGIARKSFFLTAIGTGLLIVSHNSLSLVFFGICLLFALIFSSKKMLFALLTGLALSAFYWIPAVFEHKYTYGDLYMKDVYQSHFPPLFQFFLPNFTNDSKLHTAEISMQFGLFHVVAISLAVVALWKKRVENIQTKKLFWFCIFLVGLSVFFMQPVSTIVWQKSSFLRQFQFPWRLLAVPVFATSLLSVSFFSFRSLRKVLTPILILTIFSTAIYWYPPQGFDRNIDEKKYWDYPLNTTYYGETDLIWSAGPAKAYPESRIQIIEGFATISDFVKKTQDHSFTVNAETPVRLVDHTQYFPGWRVYVDGQKVPVEFQDANWRGLITFSIPKGNHGVRVVFGESKMRIIADLISLITAVGLTLGFLWTKRKQFYRFS